MDPRERMELTREERRQMRVEFLMGEAKRLGMDLAPEDFEHEDYVEDLEDVYMTEEQIKKMREVEEAFMARRPVAPAPPPRVPEPVHTVCNVVRLDNVIRTAVSDALKERLIAYAPIERLYSLIASWRMQRVVFDTAADFGGHMARYGCTCIKKTTGDKAETWEFSLDMYYQQKKEDAEKKRNRQKEVRTALRAARMAQRMETLRAQVQGDIPTAGSDSEDEKFDISAALDAAAGPHGRAANVPRPPKSTESIECDEIPAYADDHVQLIIRLLRRKPPKEGVRVADGHFVVRDTAY
jgi:hypothetical protein